MLFLLQSLVLLEFSKLQLVSSDHLHLFFLSVVPISLISVALFQVYPCLKHPLFMVPQKIFTTWQALALSFHHYFYIQDKNHKVSKLAQMCTLDAHYQRRNENMQRR